MEVKMSSIGTDPEFFLKKGDTYINAEHYFPGDKHKPHPMKSGAGLQTDNVAVEFASPVAKDGEDLVAKLQATFNELFKMLPPECVLDTTPAAIFDEKELQTEQAQLFGCSPSFDAWELKMNEPPQAANTNMRSIGGHIHVGRTEGDGNDFLSDPYGKVDLVKTMDTLHGVISVVLDNGPEAVERRKLYGSAGEHRPTDYGVEYRTLSAFWLKSPNLVMLMDSLTQDALKLVREGKHNDLIDTIGGDVICNTINTGDTKMAETIIEQHLHDVMSEDTLYYFKECKDAINTYDFMTEWSMEAGK
jgi:hypothetical protein